MLSADDPGLSGVPRAEGALCARLGLPRAAHRDEGSQGRGQEEARGGEDQGHCQQVRQQEK